MGLREVKAPALLRQTAKRWRQGCQLYAPAALYPQVLLLLLLGRAIAQAFSFIIIIWFMRRLLALRPLLAYCASLGG
jgi:hypothetical protein